LAKTPVAEEDIMDIAAEEAFDAFCKATGVRDSQIGLVRHGWTAAINWWCSAPSASANTDMAKCTCILQGENRVGAVFIVRKDCPIRGAELERENAALKAEVASLRINQQANHKICTCKVIEHVDYGRAAIIQIDRYCPYHGVQTS
jgi:hypothetical protein